MKLYVTNFNYDKIKNSILNLKLYYLINVDEIVSSNIDKNKKVINKFDEFIINESIKDKLNKATTSKRYKSIIYINSTLNEQIISNLNDSIKEYPKIENLVFLDEEQSQNIEFHKLFMELLYLHTNKKVKIIECTPIKSKLFYWANNLPMPQSLLDFN